MNYRIICKKNKVQVRSGKKGTGKVLHSVSWAGNRGEEAALDLCREWASLHLKNAVEYEEGPEGALTPKKNRGKLCSKAKSDT